MTEGSDVLLERGQALAVFGTRTPDGRCRADEFLEMLKQRQPRARAAFDVRLKRLAERGRITNEETFRKLRLPGSPAVWELKVHEGKGWRLYLIQHGGHWYATHGREKPGDRLVNEEGARARQIFHDRR